MTELHFDKSRMVWVLLGGVALTVGAAWLAVAHPAPEHGGHYAALHDLLSATGIEVLFGAGSLFFAVACVMMAAVLVGDGVAARITEEGLEVRQWWGDLHLPSRDLLGFGDKRIQVRGREHCWLMIEFAPRRIGPFTRSKTSLMHGHLVQNEAEIDAWVVAALAAASAPAAARGFGRRGVAG